MRATNAWLFTLLAAGLLSVTACSDDKGSDPTDTADTTTDTGGDTTTTDTSTDTTVTDTTDTTVTDTSDTTETDTTSPCGPRECGTFAGVLCGTCDAPTTCNVAGFCTAPKLGVGAFCGVTADCTPDSADWSTCLSDQCDGFCSLASGSFNSSKVVCSASCQIYEDTDGNGVNDANASQTDCNPSNIVDGPSGNAFRCVNIAAPGANDNGVCLPGTEFISCAGDGDCPTGEGCELLFTAAGASFRCMTKDKAGDWGDVTPPGGMCNTDPANGDITLCESGLCLPSLLQGGPVGEGPCLASCGNIVGGTPSAAQIAACDTTQYFENVGCDTTAGTCMGRDSRACTTDLDCTSTECDTLFSDLDIGFCQNKICESDSDCGGAFYCGLGSGLALTAEGDIILPSECTIQTPGGVAVGEPCDPELADSEIINEGAECSNTGQCDFGFCSGLCSEDSDCGTDQLCTTVEFSGTATIDAQGTTQDYDIIFDQCTSFPSATTDCIADSECGEGEVCRIYQDANPGDADAPYTLNGKCIARQGFAVGETGDLFTPASAVWVCGNPSAALGVELTTGEQAVLCSSICQDHAGCAAVNVGGEPEQGQCVPFGIGAGGSLETDAFRLQAGVCFPLFDESSLEDCSTDFSCTETTETCSWTSLINDPTKPATILFSCYEAEAEGAALGAACETDGDCASLHCIEDDQGGANFCTTPCALTGTTCVGASLACREHVLNERQGAYVANSAKVDVCQRPGL